MDGKLATAAAAAGGGGGVGGSLSRREGPAWLQAFVEASYFGHCSKHRLGKSERNFFCTDCREGPLCAAGVRERHSAHLTLQARKASYKDAIRVLDVQRILDISGIETYIINGAKIVFLHRRPQAKPPQGVPSCEVCRRSFRDHVRFCSIQCKMEAVRSAATVTATDDASALTLGLLPSATTLAVAAVLDPEEPEHGQGVIINPQQQQQQQQQQQAAAKIAKPVTNFRVHGEQLVRNLTPPQNLWSNLNLEQQQQTVSSSGNGSVGKRAAEGAAAAGGGDEQQMRYPQAIQHKGKRIVPLTGRRLLSQFSLNSWLMECKGKRKFEDTGTGSSSSASRFPLAVQHAQRGPQDLDFSFLPPLPGQAPPQAASSPSSTTASDCQSTMAQGPSAGPPASNIATGSASVIVPKARRIADTLPLPLMLHSPTTSSNSDLSSEPHHIGCCCRCSALDCHDCTCLTLNTSSSPTSAHGAAAHVDAAGAGLCGVHKSPFKPPASLFPRATATGTASAAGQARPRMSSPADS